MPRNPMRSTTTDIPRSLAQEIKVLILNERTPARTLNEYVRNAVARQVRDDKSAPRAASGRAAGGDSAAAESPTKPRSVAVDDRASAPGILPPAVRDERGRVA